MHTAGLMRTREFGFKARGEDSEFADLLPHFDSRDRIGIVAVEPGDALSASALLLAAIGAFYEELKDTEEDFYLYPEFYVFHVGGMQGFHSKLDIWPQSKEVVVPRDPQALLAAINDRGITRLILPRRPRSSGTLMLHAVQRAERTLRSILVTTSSLEEAEWAVEPSAAAAEMIMRCAQVSEPLLGQPVAEQWVTEPESAQYYSSVEFKEALEILCSLGATDKFFGFTDTYRNATGISETTLERDTYEVGV
ncbi:hypothetical protein [Nesterenkonia ebinurensis]|uniref:hypothetical protein n=1 Tax=Nesterenkonia ebinurensis TaxID=2608252 RepID=UPI00123D9E5A|nr:hypothetical protein [Nesterenkonia ebinurensis]